MPDQSDKKNLSVLLVDSDASFRATLSGELKAQGFGVSMATSASKASELFPSLPFDAVIAESGTPDGGGLMLVRNLAEKGRQAPVILTSTDRAETLEEMQRQGAADLVHKPVSIRDLADRLRRVLGQGDKFHYFLNLRKSVAVASWVGDLRVADSEQLKKCLQEILAAKPEWVILNLHGFKGYDTVLAGELVKFQDSIRAVASLVPCGLEWNLREQMAANGLITEAEIQPSLKDALQYLLNVGMK